MAGFGLILGPLEWHEEDMSVASTTATSDTVLQELVYDAIRGTQSNTIKELVDTAVQTATSEYQKTMQQQQEEILELQNKVQALQQQLAKKSFLYAMSNNNMSNTPRNSCTTRKGKWWKNHANKTQQLTTTRSLGSDLYEKLADLEGTLQAQLDKQGNTTD